ncbi:Re/Si-specific NAD(P)(+) transhydrogenase subunit alpha [Sneathiella sp. HT1-7]|jgi:NAD(P) transhydrogenase subunit alpha|uniref:Re/Si-specific NAD(P)(+) transhydrogenase subunit alpha n=1 Tax=Sneathiella sp. HT1-7 TaxID=2887192 RepID=UPI001D1342F1|nr:Re/Si-specific NAD(P)(+) transhydrogenase subunit alpha [Sneathiella sp. HT1-7]MCC3305580.1 Re/Si-specific NAD(P)(+) transhydrogenase subunit alpha [Sneathiella sp. HT1-7]
MKIAIPRERRENEKRVAASPDTVKKFVGLGAEVIIETGAGNASSFSDADFEAAGAKIAADEAAALKDADIVLKIQRPLTKDEGEDEIALMKKGATLIGHLAALQHKDLAAAYAKAGITAISLELLPRISRAQSMDILSSQSNLAGYKAVLDATAEYGKALPMMMTAAGTIAPAKCFIMGVGVAGLQAIATARRLGAVVTATDVRAATKEQVESLGAKFVMVESDETGETEGGYAKEMSDDYKKRQAELVFEHIKKQDIVITTALIPGRTAPILITDEMLAVMKPGSVIVDLAVEAGGNVTQSKPGEVVTTDNGVKIVGHLNVPSRLASDASSLFAKNLFNFLNPMIDKETGNLNLNWEDELVLGTALTRDGNIIHPQLTEGGN